jgi:hypothetical protein
MVATTLANIKMNDKDIEQLISEIPVLENEEMWSQRVIDESLTPHSVSTVLRNSSLKNDSSQL